MKPPYTLIDAIRTLRREKGLDFRVARDRAIEEFIKRGYDLPSWAVTQYKYIPKDKT